MTCALAFIPPNKTRDEKLILENGRTFNLIEGKQVSSFEVCIILISLEVRLPSV